MRESYPRTIVRWIERLGNKEVPDSGSDQEFGGVLFRES
jgi:hypothetical protein